MNNFDTKFLQLSIDYLDKKLLYVKSQKNISKKKHTLKRRRDILHYMHKFFAYKATKE